MTSFVQPMLVPNQSTSSCLKLSTVDIVSKDLQTDFCPSPSPCDSSLSQSPSCDSSLDAHHSQEIDATSPCASSSLDIDLALEEHFADLQPSSVNNTPTMHATDVEDNEGSVSLSDSQFQCRYCYSQIEQLANVSQCRCSGVLCRDCLVNEIKLTHSRANHELHCTVCKSPYQVSTVFEFEMKHCRSLCMDALIHCGLKDEQYLLDSFGGKLGFFLVVLGIHTWVLSTSLLFAFPPNGCPVELYYMVSVFDFAVGVSTIWFILKCRYLSPLCLALTYFARTIYLVLGWMPSINLCNIHEYHAIHANHQVILGYFILFSIMASIIMNICWMYDFQMQYSKYKKENGTLVLNCNDIKIEVHDLVSRDKDEF